MTPPALLRSLRHRNFRLFLAGQLVSLIGTWLQSVAQAWLVYRLTGSSFLLGLVGFAGQIPVFLLGPLGGAAADRWPRRQALVVTQALSLLLAVALAVPTLLGVVTVPEILGVASLLGVVNAFDVPIRQSFLIEMVGLDDLPNAIALNSSAFNGARILGPALAGLLVALVGEGWCFALNALSFLAVLQALLAMRLPPRAWTKPQGKAASDIVEGFRFATRTAPIRTILLLVGLASLTAMPYSVLMPIFADRILHGGPRGLGLLMGATGVGALVGAFLLALRASARGLGRWIAASAAGFGAALMLFAASRSMRLSMALLVVVGFCMMVQMASSNTLLQTLSPDRLRGRVMSAYSMMFLGMAPFGALVAGVLAARVGAPLTVGLGGAVSALGAAVFAQRLPYIRPEARRLIAAAETARTTPPDEVTTPHPA